MQLRQLQYFVAVAEQLNFRKAAEWLYVTQPLLSKQIAELEAEVGYPLFIRNTRSVTLTPAGEIMLEKASKIIQQADSMLYSVRNAAKFGADYGLLRVGYEDSYDMRILGLALSQLQDEHPGIELSLTRLKSHKIKTALENNAIDIGFLILPDKHLSNSIDYRILSYDTLSLVTTQHLVLGHNSLDDYIRLANKMPVCILEKDPKGINLISSLCQQMGVYANFIFAENIQDMILYADSGYAISVMPHSYANARGSPGIMYCDIDRPDAGLCMTVCWNNAISSHPRDLLLEYCPVTPFRCHECTKTWCWANVNQKTKAKRTRTKAAGSEK